MLFVSRVRWHKKKQNENNNEGEILKTHVQTQAVRMRGKANKNQSRPERSQPTVPFIYRLLLFHKM